jgi:hypothetical protein
MTTLVEVKTRVRQVLEDPEAKRFSDGMLETAIRQALERINEPLPLNATGEVVMETSGRDQPLTGLTDCLYLVCLTYPVSSGNCRELEPETQFSYYLKNGVPTVHFAGDVVPQAGETIVVRYAAQNRLEGLDGAESTSLPAACESALVNGASGYACLLRAGSLVEAFNVRPVEAASLVDTGHLWLNLFEKALSGLKVLQEFGYPLGFRLDAWDRPR